MWLVSFCWMIIFYIWVSNVRTYNSYFEGIFVCVLQQFLFWRVFGLCIASSSLAVGKLIVSLELYHQHSFSFYACRSPHIKDMSFVLHLTWNSYTLISEGVDDPSIIMMASSICTLLFDFTSEKALLKHPNFDDSSLNSLSRLIARSMASWGQVYCLMC